MTDQNVYMQKTKFCYKICAKKSKTSFFVESHWNRQASMTLGHLVELILNNRSLGLVQLTLKNNLSF